MSIEKKNIEEFDNCPHCAGGSGYYRKMNSRGRWLDQTRWDGQKENGNMLASFVHESNGYYYCSDCHQPIAKDYKKKMKSCKFTS